MKIDYKSVLLSLGQYACLSFIMLSGNILPVSFLSIILFVLSIFLILWYLWTVEIKRFNLNTQFSKDARIVPVGPYKYVRHPLYLSILILSLVVVIEHYSLQRVLCWSILFILLFNKLIYEEKLIAKRNSDYLIYKRNTKRLVPFIY